jgi:two-component system, chemotaxis family, chemotaxis protein CheY
MPKKVLVVDDSAVIRQQVASTLTQAGFIVIEAVDGVAGVARIEEITDIALVICDVSMPNMGGIDMLEAVRRNPRTAMMPFMMLTTEGDPSMVARAKQAGAKAWIVKPFNPEQLAAAAKKLAV